MSILTLESYISIWPIRLNTVDRISKRARKYLCRDELARADTFRTTALQNRFMVGRACLRVVLSRYLKQNPSQVRFCYGRFGKPELDVAYNSIQFNIAHSNDCALIALTRGIDVGIDLEYIRRIPNILQFAQQHFHLDECRDILKSEDSHTDSFFEYWVQKEALVKALGSGLNTSFHSFSVVGTKRREAKAVWMISTKSLWTVEPISVFPGYASATAYRNKHMPLLIESVTDAAEILESTSYYYEE